MKKVVREFTQKDFDTILDNEPILNTPTRFELFTTGYSVWYKAFVFIILTRDWSYREWYDIQSSFTVREAVILSTLNTQLVDMRSTLGPTPDQIQVFLKWFKSKGVTIDTDLFTKILRSKLI